MIEQLCMQFGEKPVYCKTDDGAGTKVIVRLSSLAEEGDMPAGK